jgi:hypothetical protein
MAKNKQINNAFEINIGDICLYVSAGDYHDFNNAKNDDSLLFESFCRATINQYSASQDGKIVESPIYISYGSDEKI